MASVRGVNLGLFLSSLAGLGLSVYSYMVEQAKERDANYEAMCDISEHMSCSKVLTSEYGRGFGVVKHILGEDSILNQPNCYSGIFFYSVLASLCAVNSAITARIQVILAVISNIGSVYLGVILYYILEDLCLVCLSTYAVNLVNLVLALKKLNLLTAVTSPKAKKKKKVQ